ncbi:MAG TPA: DUF4244 domain-containing protein [Actinomycetota bacterium]|nr:DUF4244 domain-containing protein [Actinomycetota bacterium]
MSAWRYLAVRARGDQRGQSTAEYSLVLLVAGAIVGVFAAFVKSGALGSMFETIVGSLIERAGG